MEVFLTYYDSLDLVTGGEEEALGHPLARRMTPLQRAAVGIFVRAGRRSADTWEAMLKNCECEILFTTAYGEVSSNFGVCHATAHNQFPMSPKDFQHSLNNAAAGYLALTQGISQNILTITHGFLSVDKALFYAAHRLLQQSTIKHVVVVHANEYLWPGSSLMAKAEIFVLGREATTGAYELVNCDGGTQPCGAECTTFRETSADSNEPCLAAYFDLPRDKDTYRRLAIDSVGDTHYSEWRRCGSTWI